MYDIVWEGGGVAGRWVLNISFCYTLLHALRFGLGLDNAESSVAFT